MTYESITSPSPESPAYLPIERVARLSDLDELDVLLQAEPAHLGIPGEEDPPLITSVVRKRDGARLYSLADARLWSEMVAEHCPPAPDPLDPADAPPF